VRKLLVLGMPLLVIGFAVAAVTALHGAKPEPEKSAKAEMRPTAVTVAEVRRKPVTLTVETQGEVEPVTEIDLVAEVSGRILSVSPNFAAGGTVAAGETLVRIEPDDYRFAVTQAEAQVADARLKLAQKEGSAEIAQRQWDWQALREKPSPLALKKPHVAQARAALNAAQAELAQAERNLARTKISVPFKGRVRSKSADVGQYVTAGTSLGRIFSTEAVQIRLPLTDKQLADSGLSIAYSAATREAGKPVTLTADFAGASRRWRGRIVRTAAAVDRDTRLFHAIAEVGDPYGAGAAEGEVPLPVGLFVQARIEGRQLAQASLVPRSALRGEGRVFVASENDTLSIRQVEVAATNAERAVITSGLAPGERVVVSPIRDPREGMALRTLAPTQTARLDPSLPQKPDAPAGALQ